MRSATSLKINKIKDYCEITSSKRIYAADYQEEGTPFFRGKEIVEKFNGASELSTKLFISPNKFEEIKSKYGVPKRGDILLTSVGTLGIPFLVKEDDVFYFKDGNLTWFKYFRNLNASFLYYWLLSPAGKAQLQKCTIGTSQSAYTIIRLKEMEIDLPNYAQQGLIADILSSYDDLIENNRRRIALLEQSARLLYREWFVHLRFPGHEHVKITDGVPEGWMNRRLSELVDTQYGFTETASPEPVGPKFLRGMDINKAPYIDWSTVPYCTEEKLDFLKYALLPGDIVVIRMADPGKVAIIEKEIKAIFASYLVRMKLKAGVGIPPLYLYYVLSDDKYSRFIAGASEKSTRKSASAKLLTDFNLLVPLRPILLLFIEQVKPLRQLIGVLLDQNAMLRHGRELLLPRLINGEIAV